MKPFNLKIFLFFIVLLLCADSCVWAETAKELLENGNEDFKEGNLDQAIFEYTKALEINPNLAKAYDNRGVAYADEGSMVRAIDDFTMAIANNLNDAEAYNNRGHAYAQQGDFEQAIHDYTKAIAINAIYSKAYDNRAVLYFKLGEYDKSWADVHKIEEIGGSVDPDFIESLRKSSGRNQ